MQNVSMLLEKVPNKLAANIASQTTKTLDTRETLIALRVPHSQSQAGSNLLSNGSDDMNEQSAPRKQQTQVRRNK